MIDGDRTLHGLVWPGFVSISDDGDIRLGGFGLAPGVLPSIDRPRARERGRRLPSPRRSGDPAWSGGTRTSTPSACFCSSCSPDMPRRRIPSRSSVGPAPGGPPPLQPEILALLRMTLAPAESRYASSGDLRRELGKLLFSGPYSPSTFNLAYFLNDQFRDEIEAETRARKREAAFEMPGVGPAARSLEPLPVERAAPAPTAPVPAVPSSADTAARETQPALAHGPPDHGRGARAPISRKAPGGARRRTARGARRGGRHLCRFAETAGPGRRASARRRRRHRRRRAPCCPSFSPRRPDRRAA